MNSKRTSGKKKQIGAEILISKKETLKIMTQEVINTQGAGKTAVT